MTAAKTNTVSKKSEKKGKSFWRVLWIIILVIVSAVVITIGIFAAIGAKMHFDAVGAKPITQMAEEIRSQSDFISYDELPGFYIDAVLATEDRQFENHCGINPASILRALWHDITTLSLEQGGSTITQQLAKNLYYTQEKKLSRKFAEVFTAFAIENTLTKNEIFELYVNTIYFGSGYYGISEAAGGYYQKQVSELSDYECAMLAGLPNAPTAYSLDTAPELAKQRLGQVLAAMTDWGVIPEEKAQEVLSENIIQ